MSDKKLEFLNKLQYCISGLHDTSQIILGKLTQLRGITELEVYPHAYDIQSGYCSALVGDIRFPIPSADTYYMQLDSYISPKDNDVIIRWDYDINHIDNTIDYSYTKLSEIHEINSGTTIQDIEDIANWEGFFLNGKKYEIKENVRNKIVSEWFNSSGDYFGSNYKYYLKHKYNNIDTEDNDNPHKFKVTILGMCYNYISHDFYHTNLNLISNAFGKYIFSQHILQMSGLFRGSLNIIKCDCINVNLRLIKKMENMFFGCYNLRSALGFRGLSKSKYNSFDYHNYTDGPVHPLYDNQLNLTDQNLYIGNMFRDCYSLQTTDFQLSPHMTFLHGFLSNYSTTIENNPSILKVAITRILPENNFEKDRTIQFINEIGENNDLFLKFIRMILQDEPTGYSQVSTFTNGMFYYDENHNLLDIFSANDFTTKLEELGKIYKANGYTNFDKTIPKLEKLFWKNNSVKFNNNIKIFENVIWDSNYKDSSGKHISEYIPEQWGGKLKNFPSGYYTCQKTVRYNDIQKGGSQKGLSAEYSGFDLISDNTITTAYVGTFGIGKDFEFIKYDESKNCNTSTLHFELSGRNDLITEDKFVKTVQIYIKTSQLIQTFTASNNIQMINMPEYLGLEIDSQNNPLSTYHVFNLRHIPSGLFGNTNEINQIVYSYSFPKTW